MAAVQAWPRAHRRACLVRFAVEHDYLHPFSGRRYRAWALGLRSAHQPLSRAEAHALWCVLRLAAEGFETSEAQGRVALRTKASWQYTVSRPAPPWSPGLRSPPGQVSSESGLP